MREQQIQAKKIKELEEQGYYVIKLSKTNKNGIPDLIAIPPNSDVLFVEVKTPKGRLSELQRFRIKVQIELKFFASACGRLGLGFPKWCMYLTLYSSIMIMHLRFKAFNYCYTSLLYSFFKTDALTFFHF